MEANSYNIQKTSPYKLDINQSKESLNYMSISPQLMCMTGQKQTFELNIKSYPFNQKRKLISKQKTSKNIYERKSSPGGIINSSYLIAQAIYGGSQNTRKNSPAVATRADMNLSKLRSDQEPIVNNFTFEAGQNSAEKMKVQMIQPNLQPFVFDAQKKKMEAKERQDRMKYAITETETENMSYGQRQAIIRLGQKPAQKLEKPIMKQQTRYKNLSKRNTAETTKDITEITQEDEQTEEIPDVEKPELKDALLELWESGKDTPFS